MPALEPTKPPMTPAELYHAVLANTQTQAQHIAQEDSKRKEELAVEQRAKDEHNAWTLLPQTQEHVKELNRARDHYLAVARATVGLDNKDKHRELLLCSANIIDKCIKALVEGKFND